MSQGNHVLPLESTLISCGHKIRGIMSDDKDLQMESTILIKKILDETSDPVPSIVWILSNHPLIVPKLVDLFNNVEFTDSFKHDVAYLLSFLTKGDKSIIFIDGGSLPIFTVLLSSERDEDRLLAVFALGRIAAESTTTRDHVLNFGVMVPLVALFDKILLTIKVHLPVDLIKAISKTLLHLCSNGPLPDARRTNPAIPVLMELLRPYYLDHSYILDNVVCALAYLTQESNTSTIQLVVKSGSVELLIRYLGPLRNSKVHYESLCTIRHIVASNSEPHIRALLQFGLLRKLTTLLGDTKEDDKVKNLACRTVMNITTIIGKNYIGFVAWQLMKPIIHILGTTTDDGTMEYALLILADLTSQKDEKVTSLLVGYGCIEAICKVLGHTVDYFVEKALEVLEDILQVDESYVSKVVDAGGKSQLEQLCLCTCSLENVTAKASNLCSWYF